MSLAAGAHLGPYEIIALLGSGGMGDVYRARDTRLGRLVAVKTLKPELAGLGDARERFEREARAISRLSHPHVCAIFDVGQADGLEFLVMELLDGQTLAHRIQKGALPITELLRDGRQIADALAAAHRQGIVHRDLKPGNVMMTSAGVKLLDFGLSKAIEPAAAGDQDLTDTMAATIQLRESASNELALRFSPDGRYYSFTSNESGTTEVYVSPVAGGAKTVVSSGGASLARWSHDGRELFYLSSDRRLVASPVRTSPSLELGTPRTLFALGGKTWTDYDVAPDGKQFLAIVPEIIGNEQPLTAVVNWHAK